MSVSALPPEEAWDDTVIVEIFNRAIRTHNRKKRGGSSLQYDKTDMCRSSTSAGGVEATRNDNETSKKRKEVHFGVDDNAKFEGAGIPGPWMECQDRSDDIYNADALYVRSIQGKQTDNLHFPTTTNQIYSEGHAAGNDSETSANVPDGVVMAYQEMLQAWFACGAATGRYQTLLELQQKENSK